MPLTQYQNTNMLMLGKPAKQFAVEPVIKKPEVAEPSKKEAPKPSPVRTYKVKSGDNLTQIAKKYHVSLKRLWAKNKQLKHQDVLRVGQKLKIPNKDEKLKKRPLVSYSEGSTSDSSLKAVSQSTSRTKAASGGPNGYAYGWCTWWVKEQRPDIGGYWGDAGYSWISTAQSAGFSTGGKPRAGAIGVTAGHVVYVESVSGGNVNISEMGYNYSPGVVNRRTVPASDFQYIY